MRYFTRAEQAWFLEVMEKVIKATVEKHTVKPKRKKRKKQRHDAASNAEGKS